MTGLYIYTHTHIELEVRREITRLVFDLMHFKMSVSHVLMSCVFYVTIFFYVNSPFIYTKRINDNVNNDYRFLPSVSPAVLAVKQVPTILIAMMMRRLLLPFKQQNWLHAMKRVHVSRTVLISSIAYLCAYQVCKWK